MDLFFGEMHMIFNGCFFHGKIIYNMGLIGIYPWFSRLHIYITIENHEFEYTWLIFNSNVKLPEGTGGSAKKGEPTLKTA